MPSVAVSLEPVLVASLAGLVGGLGMLVRGLGGYGTSGRISDTPGSRISSLAAGEVPLTSTPCVYYKACVDEDENRSDRRVFNEERAVGFRIRDDSGTLRVFPRDA